MMKTKTSFAPLLLVTLVAVAGCSGIPLSTMWHFRNFGPTDLLRVDPTSIRAAVQLRDGVKVKAKSQRLDVQFKFEGESPQKFSLPLELLQEGAWVGAGDGEAEAEADKHWYLFALSPEGVHALRAMQKLLSQHTDDSGHFDKHVKVNLSVQTGHLDFSPAASKRIQEAKTLFLQIRLELTPREGFYTLYEGNIPFTESKDDGSQSSA